MCMNRFPIAMRFLVLLLCVLIAPSLRASSPHSNADKPIAGAGIIDRVIVAGSEPVFRADGYTFRILPDTELHFG